MSNHHSFQKVFMYVLTCILIMAISWEYQRGVAASVMTEAEIPDESLRLRVLANSDSPQDQWLKREIRNEMVDLMHEWAENLSSVEEAREKINASLAEIKQLAEDTVRKNGFDYTLSIEFGDIPFPTKMYGNQLYPAGEYEGLLITIGEGQGENWWCVLFPPLCFVDFGTGEVKEPDQEAQEASADNHDAYEGEKAHSVNDGQDRENADQVEVRFFLAELVDQVKTWLS